MGLSIQFRNKEQVMKAYENRSVEAWSIWCSKQFMFKGVGAESLEQMLEVLCNGATNAIYTLRIYEGIENESQIKSNTPDDGSFNFRLNDEGQSMTSEQISRAYNGNQILSKLGALEKRFEEMDMQEQEPQKDNSAIGKILEHPAIAGVLPIILERIVSSIMGSGQQQNQFPPYKAPAAINGINEDADMKAVIDELAKYDAKLLEHLKKLLQLAQTNTTLFNTLVNSL